MLFLFSYRMEHINGKYEDAYVQNTANIIDDKIYGIDIQLHQVNHRVLYPPIQDPQSQSHAEDSSIHHSGHNAEPQVTLQPHLPAFENLDAN